MVCKKIYYLGAQTYAQWRETVDPNEEETAIRLTNWIFRRETVEDVIDQLFEIMSFSQENRRRMRTWLENGKMVSAFCPVVPTLENPEDDDVFRWVFVVRDQGAISTNKVELFGYDPDGRGQRIRFDGIVN